MLKEARLSTIVSAVEERKYVSLHDLMRLTKSSESTIRADLIELSNAGRIIRLRGGAQALNSETLSYELSLEAKMEIQVDAKKRIACEAAKLIKDNSVIYIDAGTTTYYLCDYIEARGVKIMTNSMAIAKKLTAKGFLVYVAGGELKNITDAFIGPMTREIISKFNFDLGFFGVNGIDLQQGFTTPDYEEAVVKRTAMGQCKQAYVLADHSKFGVVTSVQFHPFSPTEIICDRIHNDSYKGLGIKEASA